MTWISQEHLPFAFSLWLNSLVQNQLLNASPGLGLTWHSIYVQPMSKTKHKIIWFICCNTMVIKTLPNSCSLSRAQEDRYCLCVLLMLQQVSVCVQVFVCAKLHAVPASTRIQRGITNVTGTQLQHTGWESAVCVCVSTCMLRFTMLCGCYKQCEWYSRMTHAAIEWDNAQ